MSTILLIIAALLFISTLNIHFIITSRPEIEQPPYTRELLWLTIPWISGLVLPVISWSIIFELHWILLFFINIIVVKFLSSWVTIGLLKLISKGDLGKDMTVAFILGLISLIIGLVLL